MKYSKNHHAVFASSVQFALVSSAIQCKCSSFHDWPSSVKQFFEPNLKTTTKNTRQLLILSSCERMSESLSCRTHREKCARKNILALDSRSMGHGMWPGSVWPGHRNSFVVRAAKYGEEITVYLKNALFEISLNYCFAELINSLQERFCCVVFIFLRCT